VTAKLQADGSLRVTVVFPAANTSTIKAELAAKSWGSFFLNEASTASPLTLGWSLNPEVVADPEYVGLETKEAFSNGMPMTNSRPMVELPDSSAGPNVSLYGYVDTKEGKWLGTTAVLGTTLDDNFPAGLVLTQYYKLDAQGSPRIIVYLMGSKLNNDGSIHTPGHLSVFADAESLLAMGMETDKEYSYKVSKQFFTSPDGITPTPTPTPTPTATPTPGPEYIITPGKWVEREVNPNGGWIEFDAWAPESGRANDWNKATFIEMHQKLGNKTSGYTSVLPYKIKACWDASCPREPRYNLTWDQWRHIKVEWNATKWWITIDGTKVSVDLVKPWVAGKPLYLFYGDYTGGTPALEDGKLRNIVWSN